jgi:membrane protease YdiL (CAAX protease family)
MLSIQAINMNRIYRVAAAKVVKPKTNTKTVKNDTKKAETKSRIRPLLKNFWVFIYVLFFIGLAQITLKYNTELGVYMNGLAIAALIGLSVYREEFKKLALSATILPLSTSISLIMPKSSYSTKTVIFYDSILILALIYRNIFLRDGPNENGRLKLKNYAIYIPLMIIIGQALALLGYAMLRHYYFFYGVSLPLVFAFAGIFAYTEEIFFRGLIQLRGSQVIHPFTAAILAVAMFTLATIDHSTGLIPLYALILGTVLSLTYYFKQNLILSGTTNLVAKVGYVGLMAAIVIK